MLAPLHLYLQNIAYFTGAYSAFRSKADLPIIWTGTTWRSRPLGSHLPLPLTLDSFTNWFRSNYSVFYHILK